MAYPACFAGKAWGSCVKSVGLFSVVRFGFVLETPCYFGGYALFFADEEP